MGKAMDGTYIDKDYIDNFGVRETDDDQIDDDLLNIDFSEFGYLVDHDDSRICTSYTLPGYDYLYNKYFNRPTRECFDFDQFINKSFADTTSLDPIIVKYAEDTKRKLCEVYQTRYLDPYNLYNSIMDDSCDRDIAIDYVYNQYRVISNNKYYIATPEGYHRNTAESKKWYISRDDFIKYYVETGRYKRMIEEPDNHEFYYTTYVDALCNNIIAHMLDRENFSIYENMNPRMLDFFFKVATSKSYTVFINGRYKRIRNREHLTMILEAKEDIYIRKKSEIRQENIKNRHKKLSHRERKRMNLRKHKEEA